jgi:hypothetical protein
MLRELSGGIHIPNRQQAGPGQHSHIGDQADHAQDSRPGNVFSWMFFRERSSQRVRDQRQWPYEQTDYRQLPDQLALVSSVVCAIKILPVRFVKDAPHVQAA